LTSEVIVTISSQLHGLQILDIQLATNEKRQAEINRQLGDHGALDLVRGRLDALQAKLDEETKELHAAEWDADDLATKRARVDEILYSGRVRNPKELSGYQQESEELKVRHGKAEDRTLEAMTAAEETTAATGKTTTELAGMEAEWTANQADLSVELAQLLSAHADFTSQRAAVASGIPADAILVYDHVHKQKGNAVASVEQGTCRGCQISLPTTELQQVRSGGLVRCSSCGRILFLA
jgi:predicted  nucleic acid-binding Zn-ribbon protein